MARLHGDVKSSQSLWIVIVIDLVRDTRSNIDRRGGRGGCCFRRRRRSAGDLRNFVSLVQVDTIVCERQRFDQFVELVAACCIKDASDLQSGK